MLSRNKSLKFLSILSLVLLTSFCQAESSTAANTNDAKVMTIAEIFANKASLKGKTVQVKGKVIKVSRNIMKLNWIHIQDGTGGMGTDRLIFRSKNQVAKVGAEVIAQGIVDTDLDFGYGYSYSVLVNDSSFK